jgi:hypothetical protein
VLSNGLLLIYGALCEANIIKVNLFGKSSEKDCYICDTPIYDNYTDENTKVSQISSGKLTIHGLNIIGDKQLFFGLQLLNLINLTLDNVLIGDF